MTKSTKAGKLKQDQQLRDALLVTAQENSPDGILVVGEEGQIISFNQKFVDIWSIPSQVLASRSDDAALQAVLDKIADPDRFIARVKYLYEHKTEKCHEEILLRDGRVLERNSAPMFGQNEEYLGRVWYFRDITELKQTEAALRASEQRLKLAVASGQVGIWEYNLQTKELIWDDTMFALYGARREDFSGAYDAWAAQLHPEDRAATEAALQDAIAGIREYAPEFRVIWPDGEVHYIKGRAQVIKDQAGNPVCMIGTNWDNSAHAQTQQQLQLAHAAINKSRSAFFWVNSAGQVTDVNDYACQSLGYSREELLGMYVWDFDPDLPAESWPKRWAEQGEKRTRTFEARHRRKDGTVFPVEITANRIAVNGEEYSFSFVLDITERKQAQEKQLHAVLEASAEAMLLVDDEGTIIFANSASEQTFGYPVAELAGLNVDALVPLRIRARHGQLRAEFMRNPQPRPMAASKRLSAVRKDGSEFPVEIGLSFMQMNNRTVVIATIDNITKRKQDEQELQASEERWKFALEGGGEGVWDWDIETGEVFLSPRCKEILGIAADAGEGQLSEWKSTIHPEDLPGVMEDLQAHLDGKTDAHIVEHRVLLEDGSWKWLLTRGKVVSRNANGKALRMIGTQEDITERKQLELSLQKAKHAAESANRAKSEFLSNMSHELRTPLNAILGFSELMKGDADEPLTPSHQEYTGEIYKAGKHLLRIISDIIDLARIEAGKLEISLESIYLAQLVRDCNALLAPVASRYNVILMAPGDIPPSLCVIADHTRLKQVLINLMTNAMKYNRKNGVVQVVVEPAEKEGCVRIAVKDTGMGISRENQAQLFQSFNRLGMEGAGIEGTGIGLALTKRLVELIGGKIGLESKEGIGSTFWVSLPLGAAPQTVAPASESQAAASAPSPPSIKKRVLYIEDNPSNRMLMEAIMKRFTHIEFATAPSAEIGLPLIDFLQPDLVLLDVNLPGMDGYQALAQLKQSEHTRDIPVIAMTANAFKADIEHAEESGFSGYLTKPVSIHALQDILDKHLKA
ncbi:MAG: hypothetical protein A3B82_04080 [Methylophilales bacterium RIFCSPHIGHO2_02_FULL_57_10]|nr:MAG: hypothetical protein A3B82_04080 [Methylophilales bacterium RIFCSPHIGHO2_02_FULL_57_10]